MQQLRLPLRGGRITYEQSLLLPLITLEDGKRVLFDYQLNQNEQLRQLVYGPYRGCFKPLDYLMAWQFREPDHRGRVRAYEAPEEEGMLWVEGEKILDPP